MANFRETIGIKILQRHTPAEKSEALRQLTKSKTAGIVYDTQRLSRKELNKVLHVFESEGLKAESLGFVNDKELKEEHLSEKGDVFYCKKDLSFWYLPKGVSVTQFTEKQFDYLINLDCAGLLPLQAISARSMAKVRMAKHFEQYAFAHDFMSETKADSEWELFEEIIKYIK